MPVFHRSRAACPCVIIQNLLACRPAARRQGRPDGERGPAPACMSAWFDAQGRDLQEHEDDGRQQAEEQHWHARADLTLAQESLRLRAETRQLLAEAAGGDDAWGEARAWLEGEGSGQGAVVGSEQGSLSGDGHLLATILQSQSSTSDVPRAADGMKQADMHTDAVLADSATAQHLVKAAHGGLEGGAGDSGAGAASLRAACPTLGVWHRYQSPNTTPASPALPVHPRAAAPRSGEARPEGGFSEAARRGSWTAAAASRGLLWGSDAPQPALGSPWLAAPDLETPEPWVPTPEPPSASVASSHVAAQHHAMPGSGPQALPDTCCVPEPALVDDRLVGQELQEEALAHDLALLRASRVPPDTAQLASFQQTLCHAELDWKDTLVSLRQHRHASKLERRMPRPLPGPSPSGLRLAPLPSGTSQTPVSPAWHRPASLVLVAGTRGVIQQALWACCMHSRRVHSRRDEGARHVEQRWRLQRRSGGLPRRDSPCPPASALRQASRLLHSRRDQGACLGGSLLAARWP